MRLRVPVCHWSVGWQRDRSILLGERCPCLAAGVRQDDGLVFTLRVNQGGGGRGAVPGVHQPHPTVSRAAATHGRHGGVCSVRQGDPENEVVEPEEICGFYRERVMVLSRRLGK